MLDTAGAAESSSQRACVGVPKTHGALVAARDDPGSVLCKLSAGNEKPCVAPSAFLVAGGRVPELGAVTAACGKELLAIGRKIHAEDAIAVTGAGYLHHPRGQVPDADQFIPARRRQAPSVRGEGDAAHFLRMTERFFHLAVCDVE